MKLSHYIAATTDRWNAEAELGFARCGAAGGKLVREVWANGKTMVGPEGALANRFIPLARAIEIYRAGWKI